MESGKDITDEERSAILALAGANKSEPEIARWVKRSKTAVHQVIVKSQARRSTTRAGRVSFLTLTTVRAILRNASNGNYSARELRDMFKCPVSVRRVQQILTNSANLVYKKMVTGPRLTNAHIQARKKWAHDHAG